MIRNSIVHEGNVPSIRELMRALGYKSPRSAAMIIASLIKKGFLGKKTDKTLMLKSEAPADKGHVQTVNVPLVGTVACGTPVLADENIEAMIPVSIDLAQPRHRYFLLRVTGDSMNKVGIQEGNLLLVRQQTIAKNGDTVVACIDGETTVKEFRANSEVVILQPQSTNPTHKPIILSTEFSVQGIVVKVIKDFL